MRAARGDLPVARGGQIMARKMKLANDPTAIKEPEEWTTGDEPMTGAQESYLNTLSREAGENAPEELTKAEASKEIEELQEQTGRGAGARAPRRPARKQAPRRK